MELILIIPIMIVSTIIGSLGAIYLKKGSDGFSLKFDFDHILSLITNSNLIVGGILYFVASLAFIYMLRDTQLSLLYPLTSMSYIFVSIFSVWLLKENMNIYKYLGIASIVIGVVLVTV